MKVFFEALWTAIVQSIQADDDAAVVAHNILTEYIAPPLNVFSEMHNFLQHIGMVKIFSRPKTTLMVISNLQVQLAVLQAWNMHSDFVLSMKQQICISVILK
jgi:hypothetical protein